MTPDESSETLCPNCHVQTLGTITISQYCAEHGGVVFPPGLTSVPVDGSDVVYNLIPEPQYDELKRAYEEASRKAGHYHEQRMEADKRIDELEDLLKEVGDALRHLHINIHRLPAHLHPPSHLMIDAEDALAKLDAEVEP